MQSAKWYWRRLQSMGAREICWRLKARLRDAVDRRLASRRARPLGIEKVRAGHLDPAAVNPAVVSQELPTVNDWSVLGHEGEVLADSLIVRADRIRQNRLTLFDLTDCELGECIDWNREYKAGRQIPLRFAADIDYRDYQEVGDCKFAWEPSRFSHLVALGRAYCLTGNRVYAESVVQHVQSWMDQCPLGMGMQWRSPLELGVRLVNWVWALELIRSCEVLTPAFWSRLLPVVYWHLWEISRKYSRFSSANNHLIGEAAGVFIASSYFPGLRHAARWQRESHEILEREIFAQTYADGGTREQAMGYQCFVLEFFVLAGLAARRIGMDFPPAWWARLERMFDFLCAFAEGGEKIPPFGDCDDGFVLDLGTRATNPRELLAIGAVLFGRADFKAAAGDIQEPGFWLMGVEGAECFRQIDTDGVPRRLSSRALPDSGYYLLQYSQRGDDDTVSIVFDCGELGMEPIAAHGHADALSVMVRLFGRDLLVDAGTYDYFSFDPWRDYFRSTRAHNTVVVDQQDQSEMLGRFLWGRRAQVRCCQWLPDSNGGTVVGEHDGYRRLPGRVLHRRTVTLDGPKREILIRDELQGVGPHTATVYFHFGEDCTLGKVVKNLFRTELAGRQVDIEFDSALAVQEARGNLEPPLGWVSRSYHQRSPIAVLSGNCQWCDSIALNTRLCWTERL